MSTKTNRKKCLIVVAAFLCSTVSNAKASFASETIENVAVAVASLSLVTIDTWTQKADMPAARSLLSASTVDGKIYAIGGYGGRSAVEEYDPATDTWTTKTSLPTPRQWLSTSVVNGKIYAIGGDAYDQQPSLSTVEAYDPVTDTWTEKAPMLTARFGHTTSTVNGKIYAIGGWLRPPNRLISDVEEYDPATDTWTKKAPMPTARTMLSTSVVDGKIYAIGGTTWRAGLSTVEVYDPATDTWTAKAPMPTARTTFLSTSVVNGIIYVIGGTSDEPAFSTVEAYDPATDTWTEKTSMPGVRGSLATSVVNGKIYAIGGRTAAHGANLSTVEEYDATPPLVVDFNGDGIVDSADMSIMVDHWHTDYPLCDIAPAPFGDGIVDVQDLIFLSEHLLEELDDPTLMAHWALDETEGVTAHDNVNDIDDYVFGGAIWQPAGGMIGGALEFDGIDDCIISGTGLNSAERPFSVVTWIKGATPGQAIISQPGGVDWLAVDAEGNLMTELKGSGRSAASLFSQSLINDDQWHRIGLVWDGSKRMLCVDGVSVAEDIQDSLGFFSSGLYIGVGKNYATGTFFSGLIDDVRIYNRVVSP